MVEWLIQTDDAHPALARGQIPPGVFDPEEQSHYRTLYSDKRRRDWLLGRWTTKRLLQVILSRGQAPVPLAAIILGNDQRGAPFSTAPRPLTAGQISISHSRRRAFCGVSLDTYPVGVDLEYVEPRSEAFVADYFSTAEQRLVEATPSTRRAHIVTAIWSGKEAALKALQIGLRVDTRAVTCLCDPAAAPTRWTPFEIRIQQRRLPAVRTSLQGWWRVADGFVYTVAAPAGSPPPADRPVDAPGS